MMSENNYVVRYYFSFEENRKFYIVMESCLRNVTSILKDKKSLKISETIIKKIFKNVAKALKKMHKQTVLYFI